MNKANGIYCGTIKNGFKFRRTPVVGYGINKIRDRKIWILVDSGIFRYWLEIWICGDPRIRPNLSVRSIPD